MGNAVDSPRQGRCGRLARQRRFHRMPLVARRLLQLVAGPVMSLSRLRALALAAVVLACNTPFIPLPPPADPTFTPVMVSDGMGGTRTMWETRGAGVMAGARVSVFSIDGGTGVIARAQADGTYVTNPLDGRVGDRIQLHYEDV